MQWLGREKGKGERSKDQEKSLLETLFKQVEQIISSCI